MHPPKSSPNPKITYPRRMETRLGSRWKQIFLKTLIGKLRIFLSRKGNQKPSSVFLGNPGGLESTSVFGKRRFSTKNFKLTLSSNSESCPIDTCENFQKKHVKVEVPQNERSVGMMKWKCWCSKRSKRQM